MKKFFRLSATFVLMGALLAGCIENEVSPGLEAMRQAKADLIKANAEWVRAHAKVEESNAAYQNALAEVERANAALIQAQVTVVAADAKIKEAEAKIKEALAAQEQAKAEYEAIMNEYQEALNDLALQQNEQEFALKMQELQNKLDEAELALREKELALQFQEEELEAFKAQKAAEIAKWQAETKGWQIVLEQAIRADQLAAVEFEAELLKANYDLDKLVNDLADQVTTDTGVRIMNHVNALRAISASLQANLGEKAAVTNEITELNARLTMIQELSPIAFEAALTEWEAAAAKELAYTKEFYDYACELAAIQDAKNFEDLKALGKEVNAKVVELKELVASQDIQLAAMHNSDEFQKADAAFRNAVAAYEDWTEAKDLYSKEDIANFVAKQNVPADFAALQAWTDTSMDAENDVLATRAINGKNVVAAIIDGKFGLYTQDGPAFKPVTGDVNAAEYRALLQAAYITACHDRIFEYQAALDAEALQKEMQTELDRDVNMYLNEWNVWKDIYQGKGKNKTKKDAWLNKIKDFKTKNAAIAPAKTAMDDAKKAMDQAQTAFNQAKAAADAAKKAVMDANAQARQDLVTYIQSVKDAILGVDSTPGAETLNTWLSSLQLSELLGGITFNPQALLQLFIGAPNYDKIETVLNYIINEVNAADRIIASARDFKAIIDGSENTLGYFDLIKAYDGFEGAEPVLEATSIYAYHAWFILYALMEGVEVNVGNGVFTVGRFESAVDQLMKHFLCNDKLNDMLSKKGGLVGVQNTKNQALTAATNTYNSKKTAHTNAVNAANTAKNKCEDAYYDWAAAVESLTTLEANMFGAKYATKWWAEEPKGGDFTNEADAIACSFFKADEYMQPDFHFYLDAFLKGTLLPGEGTVYPNLVEEGNPVYWVGRDMWMHNVGLEGAGKFYQCPDYTTDLELWKEAEISDIMGPFYPRARAAIRKYDNFMLVYNHQDEYKALGEHIAAQIVAIKAEIDAANAAAREALNAEYDALVAAVDAADAKLRELAEPIHALKGEQFAAKQALDYYEDVFTNLVVALEYQLNTEFPEAGMSINEFVEKAKANYYDAKAWADEVAASRKVYEELGVITWFEGGDWEVFATQAANIQAQIDALAEKLAQLNLEQDTFKASQVDLTKKLQDLL